MAINFTNRFTAGGNTGLFTTLYGTCDTAAATAAKTVTVDDFVLEAQARVTVKFTYANSAASPTLNVNGSGAKEIRWRGAALPSTQYWADGQVIDFVYDGTYWNMIGAANDNNTNTDTKVKCTALATITSGTETLYPVLMCNTTSPNSGTAYEARYNTDVAISNYGVLMGAAWNDYAEYRESDCQESGRVICENGDDTLSLATERLQPGAEIISDTFGFAIGKTNKAQTPIAISGRVLAYTYEDRNSYKPGDAVCAAPGGTVSKMTREEIREYPERIIGTVSAIPKYETWGTGNVLINGRIWIKIK